MEALEFILFMVAAMLAVFTILAEYDLRNDRVQVKGTSMSSTKPKKESRTALIIGMGTFSARVVSPGLC